MNRRACSGSKLFEILMVFLKEFFQKVNFEKKSVDDKKHEKLELSEDMTIAPL